MNSFSVGGKKQYSGGLCETLKIYLNNLMNHLQEWAIIALQRWPEHYPANTKSCKSFKEDYRAKMAIVYEHYKNNWTIFNRP